MKRRRRPTDRQPAAALHSVGDRVRLALFGATRPARALAELFRKPAEVIDPQEADPRAVVPADPPEEWVNGGGEPDIRPANASVNPEVVTRREER